MKKIICILILINFLLLSKFACADTITNWQFYLNDSIIYKETISIWNDTIDNNDLKGSLPITKIYNYNLLTDSLGLNYYCDYSSPQRAFYFIKDENNNLIYVTTYVSFKPLKFTDNFTYVVRTKRVYIPLWEILFEQPRANYPTILYIYYLSPNRYEFPNKKERLLGIIEFY